MHLSFNVIFLQCVESLETDTTPNYIIDLGGEAGIYLWKAREYIIALLYTPS